MAKVAVEREGSTTIVSIDRFAEARNAVDPETAGLLREAFFAFDADESQSVAILTGRGGTFCAGYDLKVAAQRTGQDPLGPNTVDPQQMPQVPGRLPHRIRIEGPDHPRPIAQEQCLHPPLVTFGLDQV